MIEALVKKGIFRNANHAIWFISSVGFLAIVLGIYLGVCLKVIIVAVALLVHVVPFVSSFYVIIIKKRVGEIYSRDCIWFNGLMLIIYFAFFISLNW